MDYAPHSIGLWSAACIKQNVTSGTGGPNDLCNTSYINNHVTDSSYIKVIRGFTSMTRDDPDLLNRQWYYESSSPWILEAILIIYSILNEDGGNV